MEHKYWQEAIKVELMALEENLTREVVPCPPSVKPLGSKFVFNIKICSDGSINRYKARLVVLGNKQECGLDYEETFAPMAKMTTVRTIFAIVASESWQIHQLDVKNVFLHGDLKEEVYIKLPTSMPSLPNATPVDTPIEVNVKLQRDEGVLLQDPTFYRKLVRSLIYLTIARPDISFVVHTVSKFMQNPRQLHLSAVQRIIR